MTTKYKSTLRHASGLAAVFGLVAFLSVFGPLVGGSSGFSAASAGAVLFVGWRFRGMHLVLTDDSLVYRGWFKRYEFPYSSIDRVIRPAAKGWPKDRIYGHSVFEVVSGGSRARINLLWFGPAGARAFLDRLVAD